jgi:hypothetical protein
MIKRDCRHSIAAGPAITLKRMAQPRNDDDKLEPLRQRTRDAILRSQELIAQTEELLKKSGNWPDRGWFARPAKPVPPSRG